MPCSWWHRLDSTGGLLEKIESLDARLELMRDSRMEKNKSARKTSGEPKPASVSPVGDKNSAGGTSVKQRQETLPYNRKTSGEPKQNNIDSAVKTSVKPKHPSNTGLETK